MLEVSGLLEALSRSEKRELLITEREDHDLGEVLEFCFGVGVEALKKHKLRYSDGTEREFSLDN